MNNNYNCPTNNTKLDEMYYIIARRIKHLREQFKLTQAELGRRVGLSASAISSYEIPYCEIPVSSLSKIANEFKVEISYFTMDGEITDADQRLHQAKTCKSCVSYFKITNINGILTRDQKLADGCLVLPTALVQGESIICTDIPDNALINQQYKQGELILVNPDARPASGDATLIYDAKAKKLILRKYMCEGPMITLIADGHGNIDPVYTDISNEEYKVIGPVIRSTRDC